MLGRSTLSCLVLALSASFASPAWTAITIRYAHAIGPDLPSTAGAQRFAKEVAKASHGEIHVRLYGSGTPDSAAARLKSVEAGTLEMGAVKTMDMGQLHPAMQIFDLPYLISSERTAYRVLDGEIGAKVASGLPGKGLRILAYWEYDFRQLGNSERPVTSIEEMRNLKISVPNTPVYRRWLHGLEAVPVPVTDVELYRALRQRDVDGQDHGIFSMYAAKYYEVQPYYTLTNHVYMPMALLINEAFYQSLTPAHRRILVEAAQHARDYQRLQTTELRAARLAEMRQAGLKVSQLSPQAAARFRLNARPAYDAADPAVDRVLVQQILDLD